MWPRPWKEWWLCANCHGEFDYVESRRGVSYCEDCWKKFKHCVLCNEYYMNGVADDTKICLKCTSLNPAQINAIGLVDFNISTEARRQEPEPVSPVSLCAYLHLGSWQAAFVACGCKGDVDAYAVPRTKYIALFCACDLRKSVVDDMGNSARRNGKRFWSCCMEDSETFDPTEYIEEFLLYCQANLASRR